MNAYRQERMAWSVIAACACVVQVVHGWGVMGGLGVIGGLSVMSLTQARADDEVLADETPENTAQRQPHVIDLGVNFDTNLFDRNGNSWTIRGGNVAIRGQIVRGGRGGNLVIMDAAAPEPESPALARARGAGQKRIEQIDSACGLSDAQRARLELAVESDARRFAADIDATRARYQGRQVNMNDPAGQKEWHAFQQDVQRCRERLRQLFDSSSLLVTSLGTTLDEQQFASLFEEQSARRTYQWKALVAEALTRLDDTLALNETQHAAIEAFLIDREPPLRSDIAPKAIADSNLRRNLVLMVLAEVDAKELRAAVSDRQWRTLGGLTSQGRAMRSWIEQQGVLETGTTKTKSQSRVRSR